ncbi:hypothetical protein ACFOGI_05885 [Virgibacillus xinjiangensis]|uniref:Uncharacterized protein n=1 Tax=Virgibacillus xinjiangensis TaxID=393090 RepID=A0ABV7CUE4_9BACI
MNLIKKISFYIGNAVIGVFTFYAYLYFWVMFSWGDAFLINFHAAVISLFLCAVVFITFNHSLLRNEPDANNYWWIGLSVLLGTIMTILLVLAFL